MPEPDGAYGTWVQHYLLLVGNLVYVDHIEVFKLFCLELNIFVTKGVPVEDDSYSNMFGRVVGDWMTPMLSGSAYHPDSIRDTQDEGQELYLHFFHEQLRREGIDELASEEDR